MLKIECTGSPYEIGLTHGTLAQAAISRSIAFYRALFLSAAHMDWTAVEALALSFLPTIKTLWPEYLEEMTGIAAGANQPLASIIALNVRTEIAFGMFSDGCTAVALVPPTSSSVLLAQNWDWEEAQAENLVHMVVESVPKRHPRIQMVTEAGIIGKIGLNERGVGVCLNALKREGVDRGRMPCHLALRKVLESGSGEEARRELEKVGVAAACHILIADGERGGVGMEWRADGVKVVGDKGRVVHANHYEGEEGWLKDSVVRERRMRELSGVGRGVGVREVQGWFRDEEGFPGAICRMQQGESKAATLFNIVMDLKVPYAEVIVGRPVEEKERFEMRF